MSERRRWTFFGGLLLVWIGLLAVRLTAEPEPKQVPLAYRSGQIAARGAVQGTPDLAIKTRPQSRGLPVAFRQPKNIFAPLGHTQESTPVTPAAGKVAKTAKKPVGPQPIQGPPPPPPEELAARQAVKDRELAAQQAAREQELAAQRARQQQEQILQGSRQQLAQYRFLGFLQKGDGAQAFLGKGQDIFIVRTGETVDGRIQVKGMDHASIQLLDATTRVETTIQLTKGSDGF